MTDPAELPKFAPAVRGYDRDQVDGYVAHLIEYLHEAEHRARRAEAATNSASAQPPAPTSADVGDHIARVLRSAEDSAAQLRADAERHAQTRRAEAEQLLQRARQHTERQADQIVAAAQNEAAQLLQTAREEADQMRSHTVALALERDGLIAEITALLDRVSAALPATAERPSAGTPPATAERPSAGTPRGADGQAAGTPRGASKTLTDAP